MGGKRTWHRDHEPTPLSLSQSKAARYGTLPAA